LKKGHFGAPIFQQEEIPQISNMHLQIALTSEHVAGFSWVPFSELGGYCSWRKKKIDLRWNLTLPTPVSQP